MKSIIAAFHLKHVLYSLSLLQEVISTSEPILFSTCVTAGTIFVFMNYCLKIYLLNVFLQTLKILHMHFINKNDSAKRDDLFILAENFPPKGDLGFMKVGSLLGERIYFYINRF